MQGGAPVTSAGRKLERASNGAPRGMTATRAAFSDVVRAQNPAYRLALPPKQKMPASVRTSAFSFCGAVFTRSPDRRSARGVCLLLLRRCALRRVRAQLATMSNECVNSAVFAIMIDAEQYLSCDRLIARSTVAGFRFLPVTVK